ncbi:MAG: hypothetical protein IJS53_02415 [Clostridia bacterium]|nr:hypothetical protein [Clostridia bacterium]
MKRKVFRVFIILLAVIAVAYLSFVVYPRVRKNGARYRMLAAVQIENRRGINLSYRSSHGFRDLLSQPREDYEILQVWADSNASFDTRDIIPDSWETEEIKTADLCERLNIWVDIQAVWLDSMGGDECSAWYYAEGGEEDFYLGWYEAGGQDIIHIYHGRIETAE